ncbi:hypothetical protein SCOCK_450043 [Actinacidiphila cocklensis]|uniref:Uncharacterized protein n=1 Tax=Actinacidiphila cocklensis TaxID=887465 RepID=A0A9W4GTX4_9ACTN|nr:hypothetical protein SCOCK_450043 [Actinacidiphila cocklensis]
MHADRTVVTFQREGRFVTARTSSPASPQDAVGEARSDYPYEYLTGPLRSAALSAATPVPAAVPLRSPRAGGGSP